MAISQIFRPSVVTIIGFVANLLLFLALMYWKAIALTLLFEAVIANDLPLLG